MNWKVETRKRGAEIWAEGQCEAIFVGDGYEKKEHKRSMELAGVIVKALNKYECDEITKKFSAETKDEWVERMYGKETHSPRHKSE